MNTKDLEDILSGYKISKPGVKVTDVENKSLPFMLTTFRELIKNDVPPTQDEFVTAFKNKYPNLKFKGIVSRLKRSYLSYIREYHLGFLLRDHFKKVVYSEKLDLLGTDYIVYCKRCKFHIHAFVDTENGRYWREVKNDRHQFRGYHVDMPMDLTAGKRVGRIILYTNDHIFNLKKRMSELLNAKPNF